MARSSPGDLSEARVIKLLEAKGTINSGTLPGDKGDWVVDSLGVDDWLKFRGECKSTVNASLSLKYEWLMKIYHEALETNRQPALVVSFTDWAGNPKKRGDWVMVPLKVFTAMVHEINDVGEPG